MNPYTVLGVANTASPEEITRAYRRLVRQHHPDRQDFDCGTEALRRLVAAYEVLHDPSRRAAYDRRNAPAPPPAHPVEPLIRVGPVRSQPPRPTTYVIVWHPDQRW